MKKVITIALWSFFIFGVGSILFRFFLNYQRDHRNIRQVETITKVFPSLHVSVYARSPKGHVLMKRGLDFVLYDVEKEKIVKNLSDFYKPEVLKDVQISSKNALLLGFEGFESNYFQVEDLDNIKPLALLERHVGEVELQDNETIGVFSQGLISENDETKNSEERLEVFRKDEKGNIGKSISVIPKYIDFVSGELSRVYDSSQYKFLYYRDLPFGNYTKDWEMSGWVVNSNSIIEKELGIPPGPWINEHSIFKELSCFSCGCECYEHSELKYQNNQIYISIWGDVVKEKHKGVYRLVGEKENYGWVKMASCDVQKYFSISLDGENLVYACGGNTYIAMMK